MAGCAMQPYVALSRGCVVPEMRINPQIYALREELRQALAAGSFSEVKAEVLSLGGSAQVVSLRGFVEPSRRNDFINLVQSFGDPEGISFILGLPREAGGKLPLLPLSEIGAGCRLISG